MTKLYIYSTELSLERNLAIDNIEFYLGTLTPKVTSLDFQYLRMALDLDIKLNQDQAEVSLFKTWNYVKISQDSKNYYFFIVGKRQVAENTIALSLHMDSVNTFKYGTDIHATNRTKVLREHKDRFDKVESDYIEIEETLTTYTENDGRYRFEFKVSDKEIPSSWFSDMEVTEVFPASLTIGGDEIYISHSGGKTYIVVNVDTTGTLDPLEDPPSVDIYAFLTMYELWKKIDLYSEGLTPVLYKNELGTIYQDIPSSWNLIYRNSEVDSSDPDNVVDCFCVADTSVNVAYDSQGIITYSELEDGKHYLFTGASYDQWGYPYPPTHTKRLNDYPLTITFKDSSLNEYLFYSYAVRYVTNARNETYIRGFIIHRVGTALNIDIVDFGVNDFTGDVLSANTILSLNNITDLKIENGEDKINYYKYSSWSTDIIKQNSNGYLSDSTLEHVVINSIYDIDRVDSKLIKIIKIPYSPFNYTYESGEMNLPSNWFYDSTGNTLKLTDMNSRFQTTIVSSITSPIYTKLKPLPLVDISIYNTPRNIEYETKLLHSDYYRPKFVYDSFGFVFQLEYLDMEAFQDYIGDGHTTFEFTFIMTTTINSKWLFKFEWYQLLYSTEDYDNILPVARNNEVVIYNSSYITYLRTAYRYDLKTIERNRQNTITGLATQGIGTIASVGLGLASMNPSVAVSSVVSAGTSLANSLITNLNSLAQQEQNLEARQESLKAQAVSTSGSDDLDLLESYSDNKAKLVVYEASPKLKQALWDLFYFTGYVSNEVKIPNVNTRLYFNYLSCELEIENYEKANIPQSILDDLLSRYRSGIIFLHKVNNAYNFGLNLENWETSLL